MLDDAVIDDITGHDGEPSDYGRRLERIRDYVYHYNIVRDPNTVSMDELERNMNGGYSMNTKQIYFTITGTQFRHGQEFLKSDTRTLTKIRVLGKNNSIRNHEK